MRLKLVLIASLIAAVVGAGAGIAIVLFISSSLESIMAPGLFVASTYLLPAVTIFVAAMFVYRHTARRRKLQVALTVLVSVLLTLTIFIAVSTLTPSSTPEQTQPAPPRNIG